MVFGWWRREVGDEVRVAFFLYIALGFVYVFTSCITIVHSRTPSSFIKVSRFKFLLQALP